MHNYQILDVITITITIIIITVAIILVGGQQVAYLDHHLHCLQHLLAQQHHYCSHQEVSLQYCHILLRYHHRQIIILSLQKDCLQELRPANQLSVLYLTSAKQSRLHQNYLQNIKLDYRQLLGEHFLNQPEFTIPDFDEIRNTLNDGEVPPELEFFNGDQNLRFEQITAQELIKIAEVL